MWNPFNPVKRATSRIQGLSSRTKTVLAVAVLFLLGGTAVASYKAYDYTWNDPVFCRACHIMESAFVSWEKSVHAGINCHDCHHLSPKEGAQLFFSFVVRKLEVLPERHGKIIVPGKFCVDCHWQKNKKYPRAPLVTASQFHAKHGFEKKIECSKCHGLVAHQFLPEQRFCIVCHEGKTVHGMGMAGLPCLNCHSDRTKDLRPESEKCLFCHGKDDKLRDEMLKEKRLDIDHFTPSFEMVHKAPKITESPDNPHQFYCYECHKPHQQARPDWNVCSNCHSDRMSSRVHKIHIKTVQLTCSDCHKLHVWKVTREDAKTACIKCHELRDPDKFRSS